MFKRSLDIQEKVLGPEHIALACTLNNWAELLILQVIAECISITQQCVKMKSLLVRVVRGHLRTNCTFCEKVLFLLNTNLEVVRVCMIVLVHPVADGIHPCLRYCWFDSLVAGVLECEEERYMRNEGVRAQQPSINTHVYGCT